jgi:hypothetical protein
MRAVISLLLLATPLASLAQAWLSPQGDGTVTVLYQYDIERLHVFSDGRTKDKGHTYLNAIFADTDFSITKKLAVRVDLPFIDGRYIGNSPHLLVRGDPTTIVALDNGQYHGAVQDFRFNARYLLSQRALNIVPFFQATVPSHAYATLGHAAVGTDEYESRFGVNMGRRLDPILPNLFVQGQYAFGMTPVVAANIAPKRSYGELQLGYLVTHRITLQGSGVLTYSHNGLDFDYNLFPNNLTEDQYLNHDRISRARLLDVGVSAAYQLNRSTNFFLSVGHSIYGTNTHLRYLVTTVGFTKAFGTRWSADKEATCTNLPDANKATVCSCAKSR